MSRILRRPMFRGGSTSKEGIMSVPRKGYEKAGSVDSEFDFGFLGDDRQTSGLRNVSNDYYGSFLGNNDNMFGLGLSTKEGDTGGTDKDTVLNKGIIKEKLVEGDVAEELGLSPMGKRLRQRYLSQRSDPLGKFLINFGLNYMSARPRGGKFGALATAADAAKKPTEQLYADVDTDRLLKLKLMSAIGKSDSKVALEKEARLLVEQYPEKYPDMKTALAELMRIRAEKKTLTPDERIAAREKSFELDQPLVKRAKAKLFEFGLPKLGKEEKNVDMNNTFINQGDLVQKQNSTDAQLVKPPQNIEKTFKTGKIYIDLESRNAYKYVGPNTFRFVTSLE